MTSLTTATTGAAWIRAVPAGAKLLTLVAFAVLVVATPREWVAAFGVYGVVVIAAVVASRVPPRVLAARLAIEIPFVVFAVLMPWIATGPRVDVLGMSLAVEGLWGAFGLLAKSLLVVLVAVIVTATTDARRLVLALERARMPRELTSIMGFMLRYLDVIAGESRRMRIARESRGFAGRGPRSWRVLAAGVAGLFVRAHRRGERVHLAMLARGYGDAAAEPGGRTAR